MTSDNGAASTAVRERESPSAPGSAEPPSEEIVRNWRRRRNTDRILAVGLPILVGLVGVGLWQYSTSGSGHSVLIPSFTNFVSAAFHQLGRGAFWHAVWVSESALLLAFGIAVVAGIPFGLFVGRHRLADSFFSGYLDIAVVTPTAVFMPLVIVFLGPTYWARVVVILIFALPYVVLPCRVGSSTVSRELIEMGKSYCATSPRIWRDIILPACVPSIFGGLRQGVAHAFTGMFLIELTFLAVGLGYELDGYQETYDSASVFAISFLVVIEAALIMSALQYTQKRLSGKWRAAGRARVG